MAHNRFDPEHQSALFATFNHYPNSVVHGLSYPDTLFNPVVQPYVYPHRQYGSSPINNDSFSIKDILAWPQTIVVERKEAKEGRECYEPMEWHYHPVQEMLYLPEETAKSYLSIEQHLMQTYSQAKLEEALGKATNESKWNNEIDKINLRATYASVGGLFAHKLAASGIASQPIVNEKKPFALSVKSSSG